MANLYFRGKPLFSEVNLKSLKKVISIIMIMLLCISFASCKSITGTNADRNLWDGLNNDNLEEVKEAVEAGANVNKVPQSYLFMFKVNPLLFSMQSSFEPITEYLLDKSADPDYTDGDGISLLMYAAGAHKQGVNNDNIVSLDNCKLLLDHGADVNKIGKIGYTALDYAVRDNGTDSNVRLLLDHGAKIRPVTLKAAVEGYNNGMCDEGTVKMILEGLLKEGKSSGLDPALEAAIFGDSSKVNELIKENKINKQEEKQVLTFTAAYGSADTLKLLVDKGLSINTYNEAGYNLIEIACKYGQLEIVKYLSDKGADIGYTYNRAGETALTRAVRYSHTDIADYLIKHGAKFQIDTGNQVDVLAVASGNGDVKMLQWIIDNGYPLNNDRIFNAMEEAAWDDQLESLQFFLDRGVKANIENGDETLLDEVISHSSLKAVKFLVEHGADVNGGRLKGQPLSAAAQTGKTDIAEYLVEKGADVNAIVKESDGSMDTSALTSAITGGYFDIVKLLVEHGADVNYRDKEWSNKTELQIAEEGRSKHITEYMKKMCRK